MLYSDSAVAGEAAGIGLGLLCCGSGGERVAAEALAYAHDTQHEKIIRGAWVIRRRCAGCLGSMGSANTVCARYGTFRNRPGCLHVAVGACWVASLVGLCAPGCVADAVRDVGK